jgi:hypothetical protein
MKTTKNPNLDNSPKTEQVLQQSTELQNVTQAHILDLCLLNVQTPNLDESLKVCLELQAQNGKMFKVTKGLILGHLKYRVNVQNKLAFKPILGALTQNKE